MLFYIRQINLYFCLLPHVPPDNFRILCIFFQILPALSHKSLESAHKSRLTDVIKPVLAAKQYGAEDFLGPLVTKACLATATKSPASPVGVSINPDSIQVANIIGGSIEQSTVVDGFLAMRDVETSVVDSINA